MTPADLQAWMESHGHTRETLAEALDRNPRQIVRWLKGEQVIPRVVELALQALQPRSAPETLRRRRPTTWS